MHTYKETYTHSDRLTRTYIQTDMDTHIQTNLQTYRQTYTDRQYIHTYKKKGAKKKETFS